MHKITLVRPTSIIFSLTHTHNPCAHAHTHTYISIHIGDTKKTLALYCTFEKVCPSLDLKSSANELAYHLFRSLTTIATLMILLGHKHRALPVYGQASKLPKSVSSSNHKHTHKWMHIHTCRYIHTCMRWTVFFLHIRRFGRIPKMSAHC